jgi:acyl-CoA reductase-like NAD-dependent aldehyde dehydrogenase
MGLQRWDSLIGGRWVAAERYTPNVNPSNLADVIGESARATALQVNEAVQAARAALPAWQGWSIQARSDALDRIGTEILARREELGTLLSREEGKTRSEGIGEATRAGNIFKFFAGEVLRPGGEILPSVRPGIHVEITREPVGVVGLVTPWNFSLAIPAWKIAPALAYGNCVVFKPAELVPASAWSLADIIHRAGLPEGVFNLVLGSGREVGQALVESDIDALSFTGSREVGGALTQTLSQRLVKVQLEMGGKNAQLVLDDADLDAAVELCVQSAFYSSGQRCTAASRLVVTEGIHDRFVAAMVERTRLLRVGDALAHDTQIGPMASQAQQEQARLYVELARGAGASLACGNESLPDGGYYARPALLTDSDNTMRFNREEIFGPVAGVIRVRNYEEGLAVVNDTQFGLTAGIATTSLKHATHFKRQAQAGMVMVNVPTAGVDFHVPFGGRKQSSYGPREQGTYAREFYTTVKTAYVGV